MSAKTFELISSPRLCAILVVAIRNYVAVQYPPGSSDCALTAREALLDVATNIETRCPQQTTITLSRRLRTMLKIALNYYCEQFTHVADIEPLREMLLASLQGEAADDERLSAISPE